MLKLDLYPSHYSMLIRLLRNTRVLWLIMGTSCQGEIPLLPQLDTGAVDAVKPVELASPSEGSSAGNPDRNREVDCSSIELAWTDARGVQGLCRSEGGELLSKTFAKAVSNNASQIFVRGNDVYYFDPVSKRIVFVEDLGRGARHIACDKELADLRSFVVDDDMIFFLERKTYASKSTIRTCDLKNNGEVSDFVGDLDFAGQIAIDGEYVYWTYEDGEDDFEAENGDIRLYRVAKDGSSLPSYIRPIGGRVIDTLAIIDSNLYLANDRGVFSFSIASSRTPEVTIAEYDRGTYAIQLASIGEHLYWAEAHEHGSQSGVIRRVALDGSDAFAQETVHATVRGLAGLALSEELAIFSQDENAFLASVTRDAMTGLKEATPHLEKSLGTYTSVTLVDSQTLYWYEKSESVVQKMQLGETEPTTVIKDALEDIRDLDNDGTHLYILENAGSGGNFDLIARYDLERGGVPTVFADDLYFLKDIAATRNELFYSFHSDRIYFTPKKDFVSPPDELDEVTLSRRAPTLDADERTLFYANPGARILRQVQVNDFGVFEDRDVIAEDLHEVTEIAVAEDTVYWYDQRTRRIFKIARDGSGFTTGDFEAVTTNTWDLTSLSAL